MTWFKIESIHYGWFALSAGQLYYKASDYLGYDLPRKLLEKVARLASGESEREYLYLMAEPGAAMLVLSTGRCRIRMDAYEIRADAADLPEEEHEARSLLGECWMNLAVTIPEAVDDLVTEFSLFENGNGRALYETHWMPFPQEAFDTLRSLAFRFDGEQEEEINALMSPTFLRRREVPSL